MKGAKGVLVGLVATKDGYMIGISVAGQEMLVMSQIRRCPCSTRSGRCSKGSAFLEEDDGEGEPEGDDPVERA